MTRLRSAYHPLPQGLCLSTQVPYNMERIFWLLSGSNSQATRALMEQFEKTQRLTLPKELHSKVSYYPSSSEKGKDTATSKGRGWRSG